MQFTNLRIYSLPHETFISIVNDDTEVGSLVLSHFDYSHEIWPPELEEDLTALLGIAMLAIRAWEQVEGEGEFIVQVSPLTA